MGVWRRLHSSGRLGWYWQVLVTESAQLVHSLPPPESTANAIYPLLFCYFAVCIIFIREIIVNNVKRILSPCNIEYSCETQSLEVVHRGPTYRSLYMAVLLQHKMKFSMTSRVHLTVSLPTLIQSGCLSGPGVPASLHLSDQVDCCLQSVSLLRGLPSHPESQPFHLWEQTLSPTRLLTWI